MTSLAALSTWGPTGVVTATIPNNNFAAIRTHINTYLAQIDATNVWTASQTFAALTATTVQASGLLTAQAGLTLTGTLTMSTAASKLVPGATSLTFRNNADSADNVAITDAGAVTIRAGLTVTAGGLAVSAGTITGTLATAAQPNVTSVGTLTSATVGTLAATTLSGTPNFSGTPTFGAGATVTGNVSATGQIYTAGTQNAGETLDPGGTVTIDWNNGNAQRFTWNSNGDTVALNNPQDGADYTIVIDASACNSGSLSWPSAVEWAGDTAPPSVATGTTWYLCRLVYNSTNSKYFASYTTHAV